MSKIKLIIVAIIVFISGVHPLITSFLHSYLLSIALWTIWILIGAYYFKKSPKDVSLIDILRSFLPEPPGKGTRWIHRILSIAIFLSIVFQVSWIFDSVRDAGMIITQNGLKFTTAILQHINTFVISLELLFILPLLYIKHLYEKPLKLTGEKPLPRKVLILSLSYAADKNSPEKQIDAVKNKLKELGNPDMPEEEDFADLQTNWIPALRAIIHENHALEKVFVLVSDVTEKNFGKFVEMVRLIPAIRERLERGELVIKNVGGIDANDFASVKRRIETLTTFILKNYSNKDMSFNITGGTAIMSSALILEAVQGERQAEYVRQGNNPEEKKLIRIDVTERDIPI